MDIREVKQKINKTLKLVQEQKTPNIRLIQDCIDLIEDHGLAKDMEKQVNQLKMLHSVGSFLQDSSNIDKETLPANLQDILDDNQIENGDYAESEEKRGLVFIVRETPDGAIETSLDTSGLETLELLGCVSLLQKAIHKVIDKDNERE